MIKRARLPWLIGAASFLFIAARIFPQLLWFQHYQKSGQFEVWSESPIDRGKLDSVLSEAQRLAATSPYYRQSKTRRVFLTSGGWRWHWLALQSSGAFAISMPVRENIVINRSSTREGLAWNGRTVGGVRRLGPLIAHEDCHGMLRDRFGLIVDFRLPAWLREGYCDHVAQESSLSDAAYADLQQRREYHPALPYYEGRKRVEAVLAANGNNVDALFAGAD